MDGPSLTAQHLAIGMLLAVASLLLVFFTYRFCMGIAAIEKSLQNWAEQNGLRIIAKEARSHCTGPFFPAICGVVYRVTVEDLNHKQKKCWINLGWWYIVGFKEKIDVRWDAANPPETKTPTKAEREC